MKFVDVTNDIAFRKIFGDENKKEVLISFLNAVLDFEEGKKIEDVNILNPYQLPKLSGGKSTIVDVKAKDQNGNYFIVEMQVAEAEDFEKRVLYYTSQSYTDQINRGDAYNTLNPTYFIGILEFNVSQNPNYISRHRVLDVETGENIIQDIEFNFIELPKFNKNVSELNSIIDQWVYFIKNAENLNFIPENIEDEGLKSAFKTADQHSWSKQELDDYNKIFIREADDKGKITLAEKRGEQKGKMEGKIETAKNLKLLGISTEIISQSTGLTIQEIENL
jgi:predicted transposase/invertase (TIGR01784 family)